MKNILLAGIALALIFLSSCSKDEQSSPAPEPAELQKLGEQTKNNRKIIVWGDHAVETGYEKLYFQFLDPSGNSAPGIEVSAIPVMYMQMHGENINHSAPSDPVKKGEHDLFETGVVFTMASDGAAGRWDISVVYVDNNKEIINFDVPIQVAQSKEKKVQNLSTANGDTYVLSFYQENAPLIGVNPVSFTLHKRESMMSFPPSTGTVIEIDPRMPDMGNHGSPNNVNPIHAGIGHYNAKLNYTMSGLWRVHVNVHIDGEVLNTSFDQTF